MKLFKIYTGLFLFFFISLSLPVHAETFQPSNDTLSSVEAVLKGTDISDQLMTYKDSSGNEVSFEMTYGEAILAAGAEINLSSVELATVIVQETGGNPDKIGNIF